jgi:hypothetical protein
MRTNAPVRHHWDAGTWWAGEVDWSYGASSCDRACIGRGGGVVRRGGGVAPRRGGPACGRAVGPLPVHDRFFTTRTSWLPRADPTA